MRDTRSHTRNGFEVTKQTYKGHSPNVLYTGKQCAEKTLSPSQSHFPSFRERTRSLALLSHVFSVFCAAGRYSRRPDVQQYEGLRSQTAGRRHWLRLVMQQEPLLPFPRFVRRELWQKSQQVWFRPSVIDRYAGKAIQTAPNIMEPFIFPYRKRKSNGYQKNDPDVG